MVVDVLGYWDETELVEFSADTGYDVLWTPAGVSANNGRQSAQHDFGGGSPISVSNPVPLNWRWRAAFEWGSGVGVGDFLELYLKWSDGTYPDNDDGTSDGAVSSKYKLYNCERIAVMKADEGVANIPTVMGGKFVLQARYVQVIVWNGDTNNVALASGNSNHKFLIAPEIDQAQDDV